jgi:PAS domain S-box-containing protein
MAYSLIRNLVNHLNANQGGFFLTEMDDTGEKHFNMLACYAYGRDKYAGKHYPYDEGLMGMCAREKKMIYMTDVPQGYLEITSGLGKANPDSLIILPLLDQNEVKGIIELASFQKFEGYQREFLETLAENIAISLSNIQNSFKTKQLLEETRKQAESLSLKDEQMRKNMEELRSTQKQAAEQAEEFISFSNTVNHTLIRAEFDTDGTLLYANTKFLRKLGYSGNRDVEGKSILMFIDDKDRDWFNRIWESLAVGGKHFEGYMKHITLKGQDLWTMSTYTCVRKEDGSVDKILFLAIDTTEQKKQSLDYEGQIEAINRLVLKSEFTPDGKILNVNERFLDTLGFRRQEIEHGSIFDFLHHRDLETISELWERIITGKPHRGQIRLLTRSREEKWFMVSLSSVSDMYGEVYKVIFLANEITNEKTMEDEAQKQMQNLKKQEETYRLENIELKEKLEKDKKDHAVQKEEFIQKINIYKQLLNSLDDIILISDNHGILSFINNSGLRFFGVKTLEVIDRPIPALLEDFQEPQEKELLMSLLDTTSKAKGNRKIRLSDREGEKRNYAFSRDMIERDQKIFHIYSIRPN